MHGVRLSATAYHITGATWGANSQERHGIQIPGWSLQVLGLRIPFYGAYSVRSKLNMGRSPFDLNKIIQIRTATEGSPSDILIVIAVKVNIP